MTSSTGPNGWQPEAEEILRDLRAPVRKEYLRLRHDVKGLARDYLSREGFLEFDSPAFGPPLEEYGELQFGIDTPDGRRLHLNHSPQFFKQAMVIAGYDRCFQFANCFRWETLSERRNDQLRWLIQLDYELMTSDVQQVRNLSEGLLLYVCDALGIACRRPFPVLDSRACLAEYGTESPVIEAADGELNPVWVVDSPLLDPGSPAPLPMRHLMAKPSRDPRGLTAEELRAVNTESYDLVVRGCEIAGGALRVHDPVLQEHLFILFGLSPQRYRVLLELLDGATPHGGIAFGLERLVMQLAGASDIVDVAPFPRWVV